ncbi:MAG: SDR family NAD(P)-dependent oxidoreductase [Burkholderiaceae bacterium]|nr:SDR family NAD(P)-dependent oxidoreductase [Burkholderiaceae bacterium]
MPLCIVVGAGPGIGLETARRFGREGFTVALLARDGARCETLAAQLRSQGLQAHAFGADAGDPQALIAALATVRRELGAANVLVYNAWARHPVNVREVSPDLFLGDFRVNVLGALVAAQQVIPDMEAARAGTILFTGGGFALNPSPDLVALSVGKAALRSLTQALAKQMTPVGVHAATVTICGLVKPDTPFSAQAVADAFWQLHRQPVGAFEDEIQIRSAPAP